MLYVTFSSTPSTYLSNVVSVPMNSDVSVGTAVFELQHIA
jgi:hypothetical protein